MFVRESNFIHGTDTSFLVSDTDTDNMFWATAKLSVGPRIRDPKAYIKGTTSAALTKIELYRVKLGEEMEKLGADFTRRGA